MHKRKSAAQELRPADSLATLLQSKNRSAVSEAFEEGNTEARVWVATLTVSVRQEQLQLALTAQQPAVEAPNLQTAPEASFQLSSFNHNQTAVANEIIRRILLAKGEICMSVCSLCTTCDSSCWHDCKLPHASLLILTELLLKRCVFTMQDFCTMLDLTATSRGYSASGPHTVAEWTLSS